MTKFEELWEATKSNLRLHPEKGEHELRMGSKRWRC